MYIGIELTVICVADIFLLSSHYAARKAGSGLIFVENEGLTALATIMSPTFVDYKFRTPMARQPIAKCRLVYNKSPCRITCRD